MHACNPYVAPATEAEAVIPPQIFCTSNEPVEPGDTLDW